MYAADAFARAQLPRCLRPMASLPCHDAYVLRRIIRRRSASSCVKKAKRSCALTPVTAEEMGEAYPVLNERREEFVLRHEEERFGETLSQGMDILKGHIDAAVGRHDPNLTSFFSSTIRWFSG